MRDEAYSEQLYRDLKLAVARGRWTHADKQRRRAGWRALGLTLLMGMSIVWVWTTFFPTPPDVYCRPSYGGYAADCTDMSRNATVP